MVYLRNVIKTTLKKFLNENMKLTTTMKTVLVFEDGELIKQITYKTKAEAKKQFAHFQKNGILDPSTGNKVKKATFELL